MLLADFSANTNYNIDGERGALSIEEWKASGIKSDTISKTKTIFDFPNTSGYVVTCLNFGPYGYLYISNSDYGHSGQDLTSLRRKLLRVDINKKENGKAYGIPSDNPFATSTDTSIKKQN